ncbi:Superoxide dismutase [Cu-Zn] [Prionace glauca] [Rhizoctonia solani]|uniref:Superoxide dismutase [Cu-Zn] n=1 Tax=Rhizoctonia solani TaxID=456999 RepID=A0A0K6FR76_9AGAM|nr:Superoxide dismutase [Cu-Zn] [Prionace glauca] [Rhizoctonia solani]
MLLPLVACGPKATVVLLKDGVASSGSVGWLEFEDIGQSTIHLYGQISGLSAGKHGIHVHTLGDMSGGCASVGAHFNPTNQSHGGPQSANRHVGDLGNIEAGSNGVATVDIYDKVISFSGENNILARGLVIHAGEDDLGQGGQSDSLTTGHAGARFACGVIAIGNATTP